LEPWQEEELGDFEEERVVRVKVRLGWDWYHLVEPFWFNYDRTIVIVKVFFKKLAKFFPISYT
jgi:hypothetical protein